MRFLYYLVSNGLVYLLKREIEMWCDEMRKNHLAKELLELMPWTEEYYYK